jgi:hypothetical protein
MRGIAIAALLSLALAGCFTPARKKVVLRPFTPPPAQPAPVFRDPTVPDPDPPYILVDLTDPYATLPEEALTLPPPPAVRRPPVRRPTARPNEAQAEGSAAPSAQPTPVPQLAEILPDDQRRQIESDLNLKLDGARSAVNTASRRRITADQRNTLSRIRTFIQQAESARATDIATALQLARRADLLGQDLLRSLR